MDEKRLSYENNIEVQYDVCYTNTSQKIRHCGVG